MNPVVGDVLIDELGTLHVVALNAQPGVANVTYERQPQGAARHMCIRTHLALSKWRVKVLHTEVETAVM